ncbi:protein adenylyltransferase SelO [Candidatus Poriferisodalis sp.]|uniref:protein adenylyltransferase SelO n=1 Tax=Candidatus Poriferisodalis sp. TaxID=3101277 RepID=UPI003B59A21A
MSITAAPTPIGSLDQLSFDNRFTAALPADPDAGNNRRQVVGACYSRVEPTPVPAPHLLAHSAEIFDLLGFDTDLASNPEFAAVFGGSTLLDGMDPHAHCYGGHQFGNWAGQLGDGRAIALGEVVDRNGQHQTLQLKGAGPTPYSRTADGLAVLRSSVREFLCSEAMAHLGVPTTRALSLVATGGMVMRDMLYDGNAELEPGAVVCRVAPSFVRFGNFEIFASRGDIDTLRTLTDFVISTDFPDLAAGAGSGRSSPERYAQFFAEVVRHTADMVCEWLRVGFVHGVMNTDNMSILGLTIDYGPYGWLDNYDPDWTPNTTDAAHRRYRFGTQPAVAQWNLMQLANALYPLVGEAEPLQAALDGYVPYFEAQWSVMMAAKLGLPALETEADRELANGVLEVLRLVETDMTVFWRRLAIVDTAEGIDPAERIAPLADAYYQPSEVTDEHRSATSEFVERYAARLRALGIADAARGGAMNRVNPKYVLRNYLAQLAIDAATGGRPEAINELLDVMRRPYDDQPDREFYAAVRPDWARTRVGCSQLSCSS